MRKKASRRSIASIGMIVASAIPLVADSAVAGENGRALRSLPDFGSRENFRNLQRDRQNPSVIQTARDAARLNTHSRANTRAVDVAGSLSLNRDLSTRSRNPIRGLQPPNRTIGVELGGKAYNLDLSSANADIVIGSRIFNGAESVTIKLDGTTKTISPGARVTAGEFVAIRQVLEEGSQSIGLNNSGIAIGGTFALGQMISGRVEDVVIPQSVTSLDYFSRVPVIRLSGDLTNNGSIYAISQSSRVREGRIFADDIKNNATGTISSQLPDNLRVSGAQRSVDLYLDGTGNITNYGTISSSGSLSLTAGGSISNTSQAVKNPSSTTSATLPKISAVRNIDLSVGNGKLSNTGQITTAKGNITVSAPDANTSISISATGGSFNALEGDISVRDASYAGSADITLVGGDYFSNNLNMHSGIGAIEGRVNELTGVLNTNAGVEHLFANTSNLTLGNNCVTGDPTFANNGDITISGVNTFNENVAIIANGDIIGNSTARLIVRGHDVVLLAGVDPGSAAPQGGTVTGSPATGISGTATVDFDSATNKGGNIDLTASTNGTVIDTRDGTASGNVVLAAFANGSTGGRVLLATDSIIDTSSGVTPGPTMGPPSGNGGNVTVIAGASPAAASTTVQLGSITTSAANGNFEIAGGKGGSVNIITAQPTASSGSTVTFDSTGKITAGGPIIASSTISTNAQVSVIGAITTSLSTGIGSQASDAGTVNIHAGGSISTGSIFAQGQKGRTGFTNNPFTATGQSGGNGASVSLTSDDGGITINGLVNTSGGQGADGTLYNVFGFLATKGGNGGNAGSIDITAGNGNLTVNGDVNASGGSAGKGTDNPGTSPINGGPGGIGGSGGNGANVTISASGNVEVDALLSSGGNGAAGGNSSDGSGASNPGNPGVDGVIGGKGGEGGAIFVEFGPGMTAGIISSAGGAGGRGSDGGDGGNTAGPGGPAGTNGGAGGAGGAGGDGGFINISSPGGTLIVSDLITGAGGKGGDGGTGGKPFSTGTGGTGGAGGTGGNAAGALSMASGVQLQVQQINTGVDNTGGSGGQGGAGGTGAAAGPSGTTGLSDAVDIVTEKLTTNGLKGGIVFVGPGPGPGVDILFDGDIVATESLLLSLGSGSLTQLTGQITTPQLSGGATSGDFIFDKISNGTNPLQITFSTAGDIVVITSSPLLFGPTSGNDISIINTAGLDLTVNNTITGTGTVSLNTTGKINVLDGVIVSGVNVNLTGQQLSVAQAGTISGTTVEFEGSQVTNTGTIQALPGGSLNFNNSNGDLSFTGSTGDFKGPSLSATAKGNLELAGPFGKHANQIELRAVNGNINFQNNVLAAAPNAIDGNGGKVVIDAKSITYSNSSSSPFIIDVTGALSSTLTPGDGGTIDITLASNSPLIIGTGANNLQLLAAGETGGKGGNLLITNKNGGITNNVAITDVDTLSETAGGNGSIIFNSNLGSPQTSLVSLTAGGSGTITGSATITSDEVRLFSGGSIGSSNKAFNIAANKVQANAKSLVNLTNSANGPVLLGPSSSGSTFKFISTNSIQTNGDIEAVSSVTLLTTANNGSITLNGNVTATSTKGKVTLTANGSGSITNALLGTDTIKATTVNLTSASGQLSSPGVGLRVDAANLTLSTAGSISVENLGSSDLNLSVLKSLGPVSVVSSGNLIVAKAITSASSISLATSAGSNKSIQVNKSLGSTGVTNAITLDADGSGSVLSKGAAKLTTTPLGSVSISSDTGSIGSAKTALQVNSGIVALSTGGTGLVNVKNASKADVTLLNSSSGGSFTFNTAGALKVDGVTSNAGSISLSNKSGLLQTSAGSIISAGNGTISLTNSNTKNGLIKIGANSQISTFSTSKTGGQVNIVIGRVKTPVEGTTPVNVQVNQISGGSAFFGNGITALGPLNIINLKGSNVVFSSGRLPASAIQLDGGVVITADPVVPARLSRK